MEPIKLKATIRGNQIVSHSPITAPDGEVTVVVFYEAPVVEQPEIVGPPAPRFSRDLFEEVEWHPLPRRYTPEEVKALLGGTSLTSPM